jgi:DNA-binding MarR family transcriptional regulator
MRKNLTSQIHEVESFIEQKPRTQKEIADYLNVNRQTVRRAIDRLSTYTHLTEEIQSIKSKK